MASITMTTSFFSGSSAITNQSTLTTQRKLVVMASATKGDKMNVNYENEKEGNNGRRNIMFVAAVTAVCSVAGMAFADEPKRGSPEAKKAYAPVCVSNPTARICRN